MKIEIQDYCIRCGLCEDLYPELFHLNIDEDRIDLKYEGDIPPELEEKAREARRDCAIGAIFLR
ncbi:MAG: ferredoxin [Thermoleophilia bacterium]|nr:ferredoxin [Thermoleophilia bacterium]